jgi:PAS domain S-box-containing protein
LREAHATIDAIRSGGVDSLVIGPPGQELVYSLASVDRPYRLIIEAMNEGAATISPRGIILDANPRFAAMTGQDSAKLIGAALLDLVPGAYHGAAARLLEVGVGESGRGDVELAGPGGTTVPVVLAVSGFDLDGMLLRCLVVTDLSMQRAAEARAAEAHEALRDQNAFLEQAQASAGIGWWKANPAHDGELAWSARAHQIFGVTPDEFDGKVGTYFRLVHPDDLPRVRAAIAAAVNRLGAFRIEHRIIRPDGSVRWLELSADVEPDDAGAAKVLLGICRDITDWKRIEDENRAAAAYNRSLIDASLDPLVTIGPDGAITDVNTAAELATGRARTELIGTEFSDYFTEPDLARAGYEQAFRDGSVRDYPLELRHRDGHAISVLYNASVYHDSEGRVLGVFAAARDVTQIRQAQQALRESQERLSATIEHAPVGIDDMSVNGDIIQVNSRMCQITGYTAGELESMRIWDLIQPDDIEADVAGMRRLLTGQIDTHSMERRYVRKDGGVVWAEVNRAAVREPSGSPKLVVEVVRDITAQRQAEAEVRALNTDLEARVAQRTAELERANENLEAFSYSVSHDLRAPLRSMSGFSEALIEEYSDQLDETARGYIGRIEAASERMAALIDDLLQLSRVSRAAMNLRTVDLSAEATAIVNELQSREPGRKVRFSIQDRIQATADRTLIRTVLQNLLENAWKFTARRDDATIEFGTAETDGAGISFYVRDNGAGFDSANAGKLYQPFQRLHAATDFPGTGIGLASVRRIVTRHGGRTWADGAVGEGASFYFTLDAKDAGEPDARIAGGPDINPTR